MISSTTRWRATKYRRKSQPSTCTSLSSQPFHGEIRIIINFIKPRFFCSILISLIIGPLSDNYGRRPVLMIHHHPRHQDLQVPRPSQLQLQLCFVCRVSILDVAFILGYTAGNYLSAPLYQSLGFYGTFGISLLLYCINFLFIYLFLEESR